MTTNQELRAKGILFDPAEGVCEFCGRKAKSTTPTAMGIWNYGVRETMTLQLCASCRNASLRGEL